MAYCFDSDNSYIYEFIQKEESKEKEKSEHCLCYWYNEKSGKQFDYISGSSCQEVEKTETSRDYLRSVLWLETSNEYEEKGCTDEQIEAVVG